VKIGHILGLSPYHLAGECIAKNYTIVAKMDIVRDIEGELAGKLWRPL
jgi:hypothetical protein